MAEGPKWVQIEKDGAYMKAVESLGRIAEQIIQVNNAIDIYEEYFDHGYVSSQIKPALFASCMTYVPFFERSILEKRTCTPRKELTVYACILREPQSAGLECAAADYTDGVICDCLLMVAYTVSWCLQ